MSSRSDQHSHETKIYFYVGWGGIQKGGEDWKEERRRRKKQKEGEEREPERLRGKGFGEKEE